MKAMRLGDAELSPIARAFRERAIASSSGKAIAVPNPLKKVRRGICQVLFIALKLVIGPR
jgi:hypothetical protein